ncbi:hypothetical protein HPB51_018196 [Rhipicephalus microplus]|uniref:Uncharacterized protein n=1 Tax=Rhipicephalus microplus TaxID=6941 RepID=A0A9J6DAI9_RHIMP|nr:hypothetical protein HPB51_018196 [Rhipicephalus microplus]
MVIVRTALRVRDPPFFDDTDEQDVEDWLSTFEKATMRSPLLPSGPEETVSECSGSTSGSHPQTRTSASTLGDHERRLTNIANQLRVIKKQLAHIPVIIQQTSPSALETTSSRYVCHRRSASVRVHQASPKADMLSSISSRPRRPLEQWAPYS